MSNVCTAKVDGFYAWLVQRQDRWEKTLWKKAIGNGFAQQELWRIICNMQIVSDMAV